MTGGAATPRRDDCVWWTVLVRRRGRVVACGSRRLTQPLPGHVAVGTSDEIMYAGSRGVAARVAAVPRARMGKRGGPWCVVCVGLTWCASGPQKPSRSPPRLINQINRALWW